SYEQIISIIITFCESREIGKPVLSNPYTILFITRNESESESESYTKRFYTATEYQPPILLFEIAAKPHIPHNETAANSSLFLRDLRKHAF
ncbi:hypothetical protein, partial [Alloprevotella sp. OH1205_COT-284]|uniref:hypothetical protein n=1 Tax=Alloprevotella sp. OH1205_COT-284 TaxID=2491043 RepID=UPI001F324A77